MANPWLQWIYADAPKYGVDPRAAHAIASVEGLSGNVGDAGTSFGPFQLHVGGALPRGRGRKWAESRAGVNYALQQMATHGARGLRGRAAISAISSRFERPADVPNEIRKATLFYNRKGGLAGRQAQVTALAEHGAKQIINSQAPATPNPADSRASLITFLLGNVQSYAQTGRAYNPAGLAELMLHRPVDVAQEADSGKHIPIVADKGAGRLGKNDAHIVQQAKKFLGTPYVWGGSKPGGFDCSGFVQYLYGKAGIKLGRTTYDQIKQGAPVGRKGLKPGDVIFFSKKGDVHHEALYIGNGKFIHAPHTGDVVKISNLSDPYYSRQFAGGRRFLGG